MTLVKDLKLGAILSDGNNVIEVYSVNYAKKEIKFADCDGDLITFTEDEINEEELELI